MADEVDLLSEVRELEDAFLWQQAQRKAAQIPKGEAGLCEECGRPRERLVRGHCGGCRDELKKLGIEV